jgi:hypothetical protein
VLQHLERQHLGLLERAAEVLVRLEDQVLARIWSWAEALTSR